MYEHKRLFTFAGLGCALLGILIAAVVIKSNYGDRRAFAAELRRDKQLRMIAAAEHLEDHLRSIWLGIRLISLEPKIATMSPGPYDHIQAVYGATYLAHGLAEIYVTERDFDGKQHPFLSLARQDDGRLIEARHILELELEEYAMHVEHIRRFAEDPWLGFQMSKPIGLCIGRPGVVCSVPIRLEGELIGIVAGMVESKEICAILGISSPSDEMILVNDSLGIFTCADTSDETRTWFQERFDEQGVRKFFEGVGSELHVGNNKAFWQSVELPGDEKWYMAYVYDEDQHIAASSLQTTEAAWASSGAVILLGLVTMFLFRLVPTLAATRIKSYLQAEALAESEARSRAILDTAAGGILTIDDRGVIESFNAAAERVFGYDADAVIGKYVNILMPSPHRERHDDYIKQYLQSGESSIIGIGREVEGRRKDGSLFPLELEISEVRLANKRLFTGLVRDISERKQSEEALHQSEDRYRTLVQNIDLGVTLIDADYNILMANEAQGRLFNKPVSELIGRKCHMAFEACDTVCSHCPGTRAMATGKPAQAETEGIRDDGSRFTAHIRAFPIRSTDGKATGFIEVVEDITERKQSEQRTQERQAEYAHVARLGMLGEMTAGLAHELNQPLCAIVNYIETCLVNIRMDKANHEDLLDDMQQAAGQATRAGEIIERLRSFVGNTTPQWSPVDINLLVLEVVDLMKPELKQSSIEIVLELGDAVPVLEADSIQIEQVVVNLLKNGIEAILGNGSGPRRLTVVTSAKTEKNLIECTVIDTGPGLHGDAVDQVFKAFYTTKDNGMGVGLAISRRIIEAHGGRLWASSNGNQGTAFQFTLPTSHKEVEA